MKPPPRTILPIALVVLLAAACRPSSPVLVDRTEAIGDLQPALLEEGQRLEVVATTTLVAEVVRIVGGVNISLTTLVGPGSEPHSYEPTPQDARTLAEADIVIQSGFGLEKFLRDNLLVAGSTAPFVSLSEGIEPLRLADGSGEVDPHVWLDPLNVVVWAVNAGEVLAKLDPAHGDEYRQRVAAYRLELEALDSRVTDRLSRIPPLQRKLVSDHDTLGYFAARFGFTIVGAVIPSASSSAEASARELAALEDTIRREGVRAVFIAAEVNPDLAQRVADDTGARLVPLYLESLTGPDGPAPTFVALMEYNVDAMVEALGE
jgi:manganese/iron transport system substrate-binding protein